MDRRQCLFTMIGLTVGFAFRPDEALAVAGRERVYVRISCRLPEGIGWDDFIEHHQKNMTNVELMRSLENSLHADGDLVATMIELQGSVVTWHYLFRNQRGYAKWGDVVYAPSAHYHRNYQNGVFLYDRTIANVGAEFKFQAAPDSHVLSSTGSPRLG